MTKQEFKTLLRSLLKSGELKFDVNSDISRDGDEVVTNITTILDNEEICSTNNKLDNYYEV